MPELNDVKLERKSDFSLRLEETKDVDGGIHNLIHISHLSSDAEAKDLVEFCGKNRDYTDLIFDNCNFSPSIAAIVASIPTVTSLDVAGATSQAHNLNVKPDVIFALLRNKSLRRLVLSDNAIDEKIAGIINRMPKLTDLVLDGCGISGSLLAIILHKNKTITALSIINNCFIDSDIILVYKDLENLRELRLARNMLTATGVKYLACQDLQVLDLSFNWIADNAFSFFCDMNNHGTMQHLFLSNNQLTDVVVRKISALGFKEVRLELQHPETKVDHAKETPGKEKADELKGESKAEDTSWCPIM